MQSTVASQSGQASSGRVHQPKTAAELEALRRSVARSQAVRKRPLAGTDGREIGIAIDLSRLGPAKKADGESKAVKLPGNGPRPLFFFRIE